MTGSVSAQPDPSMIGGVPKAPFVLLPNPARLFARRAERFAALAAASPMAPYLRFLEAIARMQSDLATTSPRPAASDVERMAQARGNGMPPLDRLRFAAAPGLSAVLTDFIARCEPIDKPLAAAEALRTVREADTPSRSSMIEHVLRDTIPPEELAPHLYVTAALQVFAALAAASLDASELVPVAVGVCPACGGLPVSSLVVGFQGAEGVRYAVCSCCSTQWNEVRIKCLACGSTKGIGYREIEGGEEATVKAEVCDACESWVKILHQNKNASLDPVADDVASLGLNVLMRDSVYRPAGINPFLIGY
ncbi:MAG: formate dehydrogenase accessory protein FdhE [Methylobacteriaceae bacterium]|nr:formate dehydrogenase accessory protein FdhE [Methylobacteriaceae bacterium]